MSTIDDFAILEKSHEWDDDKRMKEFKQAMNLLKVPITEEELSKCLHQMNDKKFDSIEFLSMIVNHLLSKQRFEDGSSSTLVACSEGCGRTFRAEAMKHHAKACKKIFQSKRPKFNSVRARQTKEMFEMATKLGKDSDKVIIPSPQKKQRIPIAQMKKEFSKLHKSKEEDKVHELMLSCPEGCGRSFKSESLEKHAKICKKVFQSKRAKFDSAKARMTKDMASIKKKSEKIHSHKDHKKIEIIPLAQFKKAMKAELMNKDQKDVERKECSECGRKFKVDSLDKHMKVCKKVFKEKRSIFDSVKARLTEAMSKLSEKLSKEPHSHKDYIKKERIPIAELKKQYKAKLQENEHEDVERKACTECGRKFKIESLEKHAKVCKKVFHETRAKFDSAKARMTEEMAAVASKIIKEKADKAHSHHKEKKERIPMSQIKKQFLSLHQNDENKEPEIMMRCPEGCGRTFKAEALEAHAHVCKQVFQHKRDKFDSESKRKSKDLKNFETIPYKKTSKKSSRKHSEESHAEWRKQSNAFRVMVKALKAEKLKREQPKWKAQSETLRSVVHAVQGLKKEKRIPLATLSMNTQTENVCCPNCGTKVSSIKNH